MPLLGRGFLGGTVDVAALAAGDGRRRLARFAGDAAALDTKLTTEDLAILEPLAAEVTGARY